MLTLYPAIKPFATHRLKVDGGHELYVEQCGNPDGIPVLFLHGGPGIGCSADSRRFFSPEDYHIILFDQRGAGRSTPHASVQNNTTDDLIGDIETIREHLQVNTWILFGGSWGASLALLYAEAHAERVKAMILRGVCLLREQDRCWMFQEGASRVFPDYWQDFIKPIPVAERDDLIKAYYARLTGNDELQRMAAAKAWSVWEGRGSTVQPSSKNMEIYTNPRLAFGLARLECHYFLNKCFIESNQILDNINKIQHIPGLIVHGRYDMVCLLDNAYALSQAWPNAELDIVRSGGHAAQDPANMDALILATQKYAKKFRN